MTDLKPGDVVWDVTLIFTESFFLARADRCIVVDPDEDDPFASRPGVVEVDFEGARYPRLVAELFATEELALESLRLRLARLHDRVYRAWGDAHEASGKARPGWVPRKRRMTS